MTCGPPKKENALRRNKAYCAQKLKECRAANPERTRETSLRNEKSRAERYRANPALYLWRTAKSRAHAFGQDFDITVDDVVVPAVCPITGDPISALAAAMRNGASLDRVDNAKGYVKGNVRVISRRANRMKGDLSLDDLARIAAYIRGEV